MLVDLLLVLCGLATVFAGAAALFGLVTRNVPRKPDIKHE